MTATEIRRLKEDELTQVENFLADKPEAVTLRLERARLLMELGQRDEAKTAYLEALAKDPMNASAMNNLGTLLLTMGFRTAARTAYEAAVRYARNPMAHMNLANLLIEDRELEAAREHYETALRLTAADHAKAHQGLATVLLNLGETEAAARHREQGFRNYAVIAQPYCGKNDPIRVIVLISAMGGNVPTHSFLDDRFFQITMIVSEYFDLAEPLPDHDMVFNAVGDVEICSEALAAATRIAAKSSAPIINPPAAVIPTSRAANAQRLQGIPGLIAPKIVTLPRGEVTAENLTRQGFVFPLLMRRPGFHGGEHFVQVDSADQLGLHLDSLPGDDITVIQYIDVRSADGKWRKYRAMMIDDEIFPLHAAVSRNWKIHYFSADMRDNADHRQEDADFLNDMPKVLGPRAMAALKQIQTTLELDYAGIDFGLTPDGDVVLFETNATMVVNPPDPDELWDYRRPPVKRILDAVRRIFLKRLRARPGKGHAQSA